MSTPGRHERRRDRAPNAGHVAAVLVATVASVSLVTLAVFGAVANGLTPREIAGGCVAILAGAVAALWLRREIRQRGGRGRS